MDLRDRLSKVGNHGGGARACLYPGLLEYPNLPKIRLSVVSETGRQDASVTPVSNQQSYTGNLPVISSALANIRCADLGINGVLKRLNATLGTSYTLGSKICPLLGKVQLYSILEPYVTRNDDFGTVYAYLRRYWCDYDVFTIQHKLRTQEEEEDSEMRSRVLVDDRITKRDVPPRRVWDLYSNRVVPYWAMRGDAMWGISHAWVDENERVNVMTPINRYEWPVPVPNDTNLDLIRVEMLNLMRGDEPAFGAGYAWLDVLCLRQEGGSREHLRSEEWKLDVPTIGYVYKQAPTVVCYFNGLGRPLHLKMDYFDSDRCWFRRAWTLQEITQSRIIIAGETGGDFMKKDVRRRFEEQLTSLRKIRRRDIALELVSEMQKRISTMPLDKVVGLVYPLRADSIPIYDAAKSRSDTWELVMDVMAPRFRTELLFFYPEPGNGNKRWRPSWQQVMTSKPITSHSFLRPEHVHGAGDQDADWYVGYCIESGAVWGLAEVPKNGKPRQGELVFKDAAGSPHVFKIVADHTYPISDGSYTLLGSSHWHSRLDHWVVGQLREDGKFEKLSVLRSADDEQLKLRELGLECEVKIILC